MVDGPFACLGVWAKPGRLLISRAGKPLHFGDLPGKGLYLASLPPGLPGRVFAVQNGYTGTIEL